MTKNIDQPAIANFPTEFAPKPQHKKNNVKSVKNDSKKENIMKKNDAQPKNVKNAKVCFAAQGLTGQEWIQETLRLQNEAVDAVREVYGDEPKFIPNNLHKRLKAEASGRKEGMLNRDFDQLVTLGIVAHDIGWTNPEFVTEGDVNALKGTIRPGAYRHMMTFPIGEKLSRYYVINVDDVDWPGGKVPTEAPAKKPKAEEPKGGNDEKRETKTAPKPAAPTIIKVTLPNGIVLEASSAAEMRELKAIFA